MTEKTSARIPASFTAEVKVPFKFIVVHGTDPSIRSSEHKAFTRSLNLMGLVFEAPHMEVDGLHLSFTEQSFGRNFLEVSLELGSTGKKKFQPVELIGQVEWYERRSTVAGHAFIVGVGFVDPQADAMIILREFLQTAHLLAR